MRHLPRAHAKPCPAPPLGLITLAALLPQTWEFRLINRNAEPLDEGDILWADLVMTGGMLPQEVDTLAIVRRCKDLGKPVCVGGPDPTSSPVRRQSFWDRQWLKIRESRAPLVCSIMRLADGAASGDWRLSVV